MRTTFSSRIGMILATAGSAVGLGNIWRFSYVTGENGGAAFILIYIACVFLLGIPCMIGEFVIGRSQGANAPRAYAELPKAHRSWGLVGVMGVFSASVILGFYSVVAGWCLYYLCSAVGNGLATDATTAAAHFAAFSGGTWKPVLFGLGFLFATHIIVRFGVKQGIERVSRFFMPLLVVLLFILMVASCSLPNAWQGVRYLFQPDWSCVSHRTFIEALGQAFFSLSLGVGTLCTYASYFDKKTNLVLSAAQIAFIDTTIAIFAGLMIFPAAFAVGVQPDSGPSLIFITLPGVFHEAFAGMPIAGYIISVMFYALIVLAAITSTISMHEVGTAFFTEELNIPRRRAAWIVTLFCSVVCVLCSLSQGAVTDLKVAGMDVLGFCDALTGNYLMPLGALLTCTLLGWIVPKEYVRREFIGHQPRVAFIFPLLLIALRYICPVCIVLIACYNLGLI